MNKHSIDRDLCMLNGDLAHDGYDWWWHSFTGVNKKTGEKKSFFIEYFIINPQRGRDYPVFTNEEEGVLPSYLMIKAGCWGEDAKQLHRYYGINQYENSSTMLKVLTKECFLSENNIWGAIDVSEEDVKNHPEFASDAGKMFWSLRVNKRVAFNVGYGASRLFRCIQAFDMFWHAEGMKTAYTGFVSIDGEIYDVNPDTCYGYADKNWGRDFTSPWVWLSSCNLKSALTGKRLENSVFDIGGGCPKIYGHALKNKLLMDFFYEGKDYEFNFSKFWTLTRTKFKCTETEDRIIWKIKTISRDAAMEVKVECKKKDMLLIRYESPKGERRHNRLWNGGNGVGYIKLYKIIDKKRILVDEVIARNVGCEYGEYDSNDELTME